MPTFKQLMKLAQSTVKDKTNGKRAKEIAEIIRRDQVLHGMTPEKAVKFLEDLGPTYVKLGQLASNRADLLPTEYCEAFAQLRDNADPLDFATIIQCIDEAYGAPWNTVFVHIDEVPLGSASIAQVHKATLLDGTQVAVKVRRPHIKEDLAEDLTLLRYLLTLAEVGAGDHVPIVETFDGLLTELERTTENELDFTIELNNLVRFKHELAADEGVTCPTPYPEHSTKAILVMEFVEGPEIGDHAALIAEGNNLDELASRLVQNYIKQILDEGFFHADPHEGNIIVRDKEIVWIDLGMVGSLNSSQRSLVNRAFTGVAARDPYELKEAMIGLTNVKGPVDHGLLMQQMEAMLNTYVSTDLEDINLGQVFFDVVDIMRSQNLAVDPSFMMLGRGIATIGGVVTDLSPTTNVMQIVSKHVEKQELAPESILHKLRDMSIQSAHSVDAATKLPTQLSHTLDMLDEGEISVEMKMDVPKKLTSMGYSLAGYLAFALISAGLFIGSSIVCTTSMKPEFLGVPLLGVVGYVSAFVLAAYVVWQIISARRKTRNNEDIK